MLLVTVPPHFHSWIWGVCGLWGASVAPSLLPLLLGPNLHTALSVLGCALRVLLTLPLKCLFVVVVVVGDNDNDKVLFFIIIIAVINIFVIVIIIIINYYYYYYYYNFFVFINFTISTSITVIFIIPSPAFVLSPLCSFSLSTPFCPLPLNYPLLSLSSLSFFFTFFVFSPSPHHLTIPHPSLLLPSSLPLSYLLPPYPLPIRFWSFQ